MDVEFQSVAAFILNVASAVCIIFLNKVLMGPWGFSFATTLSAFHFICSALTVQIIHHIQQQKNNTNNKNTDQNNNNNNINKHDVTQINLQEKFLEEEQNRKFQIWRDVAIFVLISVFSLVSLNLSLLINAIGFYQIAKLLVAPFVCFIEAIFLGRKFSIRLICAICTVVIGAGIVTVTDFSIAGPLGVFIAMCSVVGSGMQQILCRQIQVRLKMKSTDLLLKTAWPQGLIMLTIGPFLDFFVSKKWLFSYRLTSPVLGLALLTCGTAVLLNISQFMVLKGFTAAAYSVMGHAKTFLVIIGGYYFFGDQITGRKVVGMVIAIIGMISYGYISNQDKIQENEAKQQAGKESTEKLLPENKNNNNNNQTV